LTFYPYNSINTFSTFHVTTKADVSSHIQLLIKYFANGRIQNYNQHTAVNVVFYAQYI